MLWASNSIEEVTSRFDPVKLDFRRSRLHFATTGYEPLCEAQTPYGIAYRRVLYPYDIAYHSSPELTYGIAYRRVLCPCGITYRSLPELNYGIACLV